MGYCLGLSLLLINFVIEFVKFILYFKSIKNFIAFKKIDNIVERANCKFIKINSKINTYNIYIHTKKIENIFL